MNTFEQRWSGFRHLDELASGSTPIHRLHPGIKLVTLLLFLVVTASFPKYEIVAMLPLLVFPVALISLGSVPWGLVAQRLLWGLPFVLFIGLFNPLFDQTQVPVFGAATISGGILSFISILLRFCLTVLAVLALIATTGVDALGTAMRGLKIPQVVVIQFLFMYRYLYVLMDEVARTLRAHALRSPSQEKVRLKTWGSLSGLLLMRTLDRAERIHQAMLCRGFNGEMRLSRATGIRQADWVFLTAWAAFFLIVRMSNIPQWLGALLTGW